MGRLLIPEQMPPASIELGKLPSTLVEAITAEVDVDSYSQPAVERLRRGRGKRVAGVA